MYNFVFLWWCNRERKKSDTSSDISQSPSLCEPPGWSWGGICKYRLSICLPLHRQQEQHIASCTHTLTRAESRLLRRSSLGTRFPTLHLCIWSWNFPTDRLTLSSLFSFLSLALIFLLSPPPAHLCVVFLPLSLPPPFSVSSVFPLLRLACSDFCEWATWRCTGQDAADARAVWTACLLQGPLKKTRLSMCQGATQHPEELETTTSEPLSSPDSWIFETLE